MKELIQDALESAWADGRDIDDAEGIPEEMRPAIISAWRETAKIVDIVEAFYPPADSEAEELFESIAWSTSRIAAGNETFLDSTATRYWWLQITWMVDAAIMEVRAEHELTALIAREERAEQQAEWQRERYADAKEFSA
jgi:hypothetical protein